MANNFIIFRREGMQPLPPVSTISALRKTAVACRVEAVLALYESCCYEGGGGTALKIKANVVA
jgi:hypothetical protein